MTKLLPMTEAEKQLAEKHLHLVPQIVSAMTRAYSNLSNEESEELTQIGYLALCRAATRYDTGRPFEPYAKVTIMLFYRLIAIVFFKLFYPVFYVI